MLLINQQVDYDFANKETIYIDSFKYKQGEVDGNGIDLTLKNISPKPNTFFLVNWLYRDQYDYVYIPNLSTEVQGDKVVVYPPQAVLRPGVVGFEIIAVEIENGVPVGQLIGPTIIVPVAPSLVSDGDAVIEDADISKTVEIISDQTELKNALEALNSWLTGKENARKTEETRRQNLASQKAGELDTAKSNLGTAIASANSATSNANAKAALADTAATNANTAATNANASATATNTSATNANTAKSNADAKKTLADTAKTNADGKKTLADQKKALADTAKSNADTKKAAADANAVILEGAPAEVTAARVAGNGTTHDSLKKSLDANFVELSSRIPTNVGVSGIENVTVNNSLAGDVSGVVATGQTLVNIAKKLPDFTWSGSGINYWKGDLQQQSQPNTDYTFVLDVTNNGRIDENGAWGIYADGVYGFVGSLNLLSDYTGFNGTIVSKLKTGATINSNSGKISIGVHQGTGSITLSNLIILEGDHTDKPLEFFEGLKSAEVAEISTHGVNLVDNDKNSPNSIINENGSVTTSNRTVTDFIEVKFGKQYKGSKWNYYCEYDSAKKTIGQRTQIGQDAIYAPSSASVRYFRWYGVDNGNNNKNLYTYEVTQNTPTSYIPYTSSKTTFEPIILRSLPNGVADTYDFDTQTLTRRCGEVVLNGSESWVSQNDPDDGSNVVIRFKVLLDEINAKDDASFDSLRCDRFVNRKDEDSKSVHGNEAVAWRDDLTVGNPSLYITVAKSKLSTPDVAGFKTWLAQNPTTVVYQLAEPTTEIVENSGLLRSYDNQTTIYADSVVPCDIKANVPISFKSAINSIAQTNLSIEQPSLLEVQTQQEQNADELTALQLAIVDLYEERI